MSNKDVIVQERTFIIYKDFIKCANCIRNVDPEQMLRGRYNKDYCQFYKIRLKNAYNEDYDLKEDQERAQKCPHWLPQSMSIAADLTYIKPIEPIEKPFSIEENHADRLNSLFSQGEILD